jgi:hypothetical protein
MSEYKEKSVIVYRIETTGGSYPKTHLRIAQYKESKVSERIYWSCRNPDYYGAPDRWQKAALSGHETVYEYHYSREEVYVSYLHGFNHTDGYCSPTIEGVDGLKALQWATKLLNKVCRESAKIQDRYYGPKESYNLQLDCPERVIAALKKMGAVEIEYNSDGVAVKRYSPAHQFITQEVA